MTKVIYRKFTDTGEVIALFPELVNPYNRLCESYMHAGQHGYANYGYLVNGRKGPTIPARPHEYTELHAELVAIGYDDLEIRTRHLYRKGK